MESINSEQVKAYVSMFVAPMIGVALISVIGFFAANIRSDLKEIKVRMEQSTLQINQLSIEMQYMQKDIAELKEAMKEKRDKNPNE